MKESLWKKLDDRSSAIFRLLMRIGILILVTFLILVLVNGVRKKTPTVQPFEVPESWEQAGLNGQTVARRIVDKVKEIKDIVASQKSDSTFLESGSDTDLEVNVMGVGVSLNAFSYYLKSLLNISSPIISGEIVEIDSTIILTMRMTGYPTIRQVIHYPGKSRLSAIDETLEEGGKIILSQTDPYRIAVYHYRNQNYDESLRVIKEMIQRNEKDVQWAYLAWSNLLKQQGNSGEARKKLLKAIEVDPQFILAYRNLGWESFQNRNYDEALLFFEKALKYAPEDIGVLNGMAQTYRAKEEFEAAEKHFLKAIEVAPELSWMYFNYGSMKLQQQKDTAKAMEIYEKARQISNDPIQSNFTMINILSTQGFKDSAEILLEEVLDIDDSNLYALFGKIRFKFADSLYEEVIEVGNYFLEHADTLNGDGAGTTTQVYNVLGMSAYFLGHYEKAVRYARRAIRREPDNGIYYTTLAEAYWFWGKPDKFFEAIRIAFEKGIRIGDIKDIEPYISLLNDPRFKEIYAKYEVKN